MERAMRIELTTKAWEAFVLPLNYARRLRYDFSTRAKFVKRIVALRRNLILFRIIFLARINSKIDLHCFSSIL